MLKRKPNNNLNSDRSKKVPSLLRTRNLGKLQPNIKLSESIVKRNTKNTLQRVLKDLSKQNKTNLFTINHDIKKQYNIDLHLNSISKWSCLLFFQYIDMIHDHKTIFKSNNSILKTWDTFCKHMEHVYDKKLIKSVNEYVKLIATQIQPQNNIFDKILFALTSTNFDVIKHDKLNSVVDGDWEFSSLNERNILLDILNLLSPKFPVIKFPSTYIPRGSTLNNVFKNHKMVSLDMSNKGLLKIYLSNFIHYVHLTNLMDAGLTFLNDQNPIKIIETTLFKRFINNTTNMKEFKLNVPDNNKKLYLDLNDANLTLSKKHNMSFDIINVDFFDSFNKLNNDVKVLQKEIQEMHKKYKKQFSQNDIKQMIRAKKMYEKLNNYDRKLMRNQNDNISKEIIKQKIKMIFNPMLFSNKTNEFVNLHRTKQITEFPKKDQYLLFLNKHLGDFFNASNAIQKKTSFASGDILSIVGYIISFFLQNELMHNPPNVFWEDVKNNQIIYFGIKSFLKNPLTNFEYTHLQKS